MNSQTLTRTEVFRPDADEAEVLALRAAVWGQDHPHTSAAFFRWLFGAENPAGAGTGVVLRRNGRVVAFAGLVRRAGLRDGQPDTIAHGLDFMAAPDLAAVASARYATRIVLDWEDLARSLGLQLGICFPNARSLRLLTADKLRWTPHLQPRLMACPLSARGAGSAARGAALGLAALPARAFAAVAARARGTPCTIDLSRPQDRVAVDALWARVAPSVRLGLVRDAAALTWRYDRHPLYRYRLTGWQGPSGDLLALAVTTRRKLFGLDCTLVSDLITDPEAGARVAAATLRAAFSGAQGAMAVAQVAPGQEGLFRAAGFVPVPARLDPKRFTLTMLPICAPLPAPGTWTFGWGDMDVV